MSLADLAQFITGVGFPCFVALYLLIRFDQRLNDNTQVLRDLKIFLESTTRTDSGKR